MKLKLTLLTAVLFFPFICPAFSADYLKWPNGGGLYHSDSMVNPSAYIDKTSKIGPCGRVGSNVVIINSTVLCTKEKRATSIEDGSIISNSMLDVGQIGPNAIVTNVKIVNGEVSFGEGSVVSGSQGQGQLDVMEKSVFVGSTFLDHVSVRPGAIVRNSHFLGGYSEVRDNSIVDILEVGGLDGGATFRDGSISVRSKVPAKTRIPENSVHLNGQTFLKN